LREHFDHDRAVRIGQAIARIPTDVWEAIDRGEPEWPFIETLVQTRSPWIEAVGIAVALCDFQLGAGGATRYWEEVSKAFERHQPIDDRSRLELMIQDLMNRPVAARFARMKVDRIRRLLGSSFTEGLLKRTSSERGVEPMALWTDLASAMGQELDAKTIVFSMKIFDLMHKAETGEYISFPTCVPIIVDIRIGRVSFSSALIEPPLGWDIDRAIVGVNELLQRDKKRILSAWACVAEATGGLSLFRIDSLIWQVAEPIFKFRQDRMAAQEAVAATLRHYGCGDDIAWSIGEELTYAL
jgi:N-glycosylase/DNA lyase